MNKALISRKRERRGKSMMGPRRFLWSGQEPARNISQGRFEKVVALPWWSKMDGWSRSRLGDRHGRNGNARWSYGPRRYCFSMFFDPRKHDRPLGAGMSRHWD